MSEAELDEIRAAAERRRMTVSAWVRLALREEREVMRRGPAVIREAGVSYGEATDGPSWRVPIEVDVKEDLLEAVRQTATQAARTATLPRIRPNTTKVTGCRAGTPGDDEHEGGRGQKHEESRACATI